MNSNDQPIVADQLPISIEFDRKQNIYDELTLYNRRIANAVNTKTGGLYTLEEKYNFNQFLTTLNTGTTSSTSMNLRNVYRKVFDVVALNAGPIAGGATVAFAHGITGLLETALIYASCVSATPEYFTVVYPNAFLDNVNFNFVNPLPATAITVCYFVAEILKN